MSLKLIGEKSEDRRFMREALELSRKSPGKIRVGALIVNDGEIIGTGHRDQTAKGIHAEHVAVQDAKENGHVLAGATVYTTLEPCIATKSECAKLLIEEKVGVVVIGSYDPNPPINRRGWEVMRDGGIKLRDFDADLRPLIEDINSEFVSFFKSGNPIDSHGANFDYQGNGGYYRIYFGPDDARFVDTNWGRKGKETIWARRGNSSHQVAWAKFANEFDEIDDPTAYDFSNSSVGIDDGQIAIFLNTYGCAIVKVNRVTSGEPYDSEPPAVKITFEIRSFEE